MRILLILSIIIIAGCVPNKKVVYLQDGDELKRKDIPKDTVLRDYDLKIKEYRIQPLDILSIRFESITDEDYDFFSKSEAQMQGGGGNNNMLMQGVMVDASGDVEYIVVGKINVAGLTVFEAQDKIQKIADNYLRDVVVRVRLLNFRFTMLGEVNGEGVVSSPNPRVTMMEAIGLSGGFTELADRSNVKVIRQVGDKAEIFYINLLEEGYLASNHYYIQQNDVIIVPPLRQRPFRRYFIQNLGILTTTVSAALLIVTLIINN